MHHFKYYLLKFTVFDDVYEPAEDSFILAKHAKKLKGKILEMGCGTGIVSLVNAKTNSKNEVIGVDINKSAVKNADYNKKQNRIENITFFQSDLFSSIQGKFDYILFNPPYLPTTPNEKLKNNLNYAFDGGKTGNKIISVFLKQFEKYLNSKGAILVLLSSLNNPEKIIKKLKTKKFKTKILEKQNYFFEQIMLLRVSH